MDTLFSDESSFKVSQNTHKCCRRRPGSDPYDPKYTVGSVKQPDRLIAWGAIGYHGPGNLIVLPRNVSMTAKRYRDIVLKGNLSQSLRKARILRKMQYFSKVGPRAILQKS